MTNVSRKPILVILIIYILFWGSFVTFRLHENRYDPKADFPQIQRRGTLRVCGEYDLFSFYTDRHGQHGFHYELAKAFAEKHHLKLIYLYEPNFENRLRDITSGKYDILAGPLPVISELKSTIAYTVPIYLSRVMLVQQVSSDPLRNVVNLAKQHIAVPMSSPAIFRLQHIASEISDSIHFQQVPVFNNEELIRLVASGQKEYALLDEHVAMAYHKEFGHIDFNTPVSFSQFQAWAVKKGRTQLLDSLNVFLTAYKKSPAFARLMKKYLN